MGSMRVGATAIALVLSLCAFCTGGVCGRKA